MRSRTFAMRVGCAVVPALLAGCGSTYDLRVIPVDGLRWVGLLRSDGAPSTADPPGLVPLSDKAELRITADADAPWHVVGYRDHDLGALSVPSETVLASTPLAPAPPDACWTLRTPAWSAPATDAARHGPPPSVLVPWARTCPPSDGLRHYDVRCADPDLLCGLNTSTTDCVDTLDATLCPDTIPRVAIEHDGQGCPLTSPTSSCVRTTREDGGTRWVCGACVLDAYAPWAPVAARVRTVRVAEGIETTGRFRTTDLPFDALSVGRVRAFGVHDDAVLVSTVEPTGLFSGLCTGSGSTLLRLDPETLGTVSTRTDPVCITALLPDPTGTGFLAAGYTQGATLTVGRLDADGRWTQQRTDAAVSAGLAPNGAGLLRLALVDGRLLVSEAVQSVALPFSRIHTLDLDSLEPLRSPRALSDTITGLAEVRPGTLLITRGDGLSLIGTDDEIIPTATQLFTHDEAHSTRVLSGRRVLVLDTGGLRGVVDVDVQRARPTFLGAARVFERTALITALEPRVSGVVWATAAVPLDNGRRWTAALTQVEITDSVRVLPGLAPLLHDGVVIDGPVIALQHDRAGRSWGVAPWAGVVVRIDPLGP